MNKSKLLGIFLLVFCCALPSAEGKRRYKYYLDPDRAEDTLSKIKLNSPLSHDKWASLLGSKLFDRYAVQPGDNLWNISRRSLGDPKLWRKLWQVNPTLTNPHEINVGQVLRYDREGRDPASFEIPLVHLVPNKAGAINDLDSDSVINLEIKNQFRPDVFVIQDEEVLGEVTGSYSARTWLADTDSVYFKFDSDEMLAAPKAKYSIVRLEHGVGGLGDLVYLVGEVSVLSHTAPDTLVKAEITRHLGQLQRGDKVIAVRDPVRPPAIFNPPDDFKTKIVMGRFEEARYFSQGEIVILDKGEADAMKSGYFFRVMDTLDPQADSESTVLPDYKGEVQVLSVGKFASVGLILRNRMPLQVGDTLVAAQLFADRPPPPRQQIKEIDID